MPCAEAKPGRGLHCRSSATVMCPAKRLPTGVRPVPEANVAQQLLSWALRLPTYRCIEAGKWCAVMVLGVIDRR